eukprot:COSAG03_NODE_773_length_5911_cov_7.551961_4_plen_160_part_00
MSILGKYKAMAEAPDANVAAPTLQLGDAVLFSKCTVHTTSGVNTVGAPRRAFQMRFASNPMPKKRLDGLSGSFPADGTFFQSEGDEMGGAAYPLLWPATLASEDAPRSQGLLYKTRADWAALLASHPFHMLVTGFARTLAQVPLSLLEPVQDRVLRAIA